MSTCHFCNRAICVCDDAMHRSAPSVFGPAFIALLMLLLGMFFGFWLRGYSV